jgi:hypothetical protein
MPVPAASEMARSRGRAGRWPVACLCLALAHLRTCVVTLGSVQPTRPQRRAAGAGAGLSNTQRAALAADMRKFLAFGPVALPQFSKTWPIRMGPHAVFDTTRYSNDPAMGLMALLACIPGTVSVYRADGSNGGVRGVQWARLLHTHARDGIARVREGTPEDLPDCE